MRTTMAKLQKYKYRRNKKGPKTNPDKHAICAGI